MLRCGAPTHLNSPHLLPTLTFIYISPYLPHTPSHFPTPPFIPLPTFLLPLPTPQHIFLLSPHLPSPSQSVAKLPCDEVSVAKLLWRSYHVAKLLATLPVGPYELVNIVLQYTAHVVEINLSAQNFIIAADTSCIDNKILANHASYKNIDCILR